MSSDLYEVLSLAARYLFSLLGILIVLRSFIWLLQDHAETRSRLRNLANAGMIGELIVLSGSADLSPGTVIPVPWEGIMGSVRSCDLYIPCEGIRKQHLSFSFQPGKGLLVQPWNGCEARVNDILLTCRSKADEAPMINGSFLQAGSALLRLRLFTGLDCRTGFQDSESVLFSRSMYPVAEKNDSDSTDREPLPLGSPMSAYNPFGQADPACVESFPDSQKELIPFPVNQGSPSPDIYEHSDRSAEHHPSDRRKRSRRNWEADWSE